jgi:hypothetical protein
MCITWIIHQQLWWYKAEDKLQLRLWIQKSWIPLMCTVGTGAGRPLKQGIFLVLISIRGRVDRRTIVSDILLLLWLSFATIFIEVTKWHPVGLTSQFPVLIGHLILCRENEELHNYLVATWFANNINYYYHHRDVTVKPSPSPSLLHDVLSSS